MRPKPINQMLTKEEIEDLRADAAEALSGSNLKGAIMQSLDRLIEHHAYLSRRLHERIHGTEPVARPPND